MLLIPKVLSSQLTYQRVTRGVQFDDGVVLILKVGENLLDSSYEDDYTIIWDKDNQAIETPEWAVGFNFQKLERMFGEDYIAEDPNDFGQEG